MGFKAYRPSERGILGGPGSLVSPSAQEAGHPHTLLNAKPKTSALALSQSAARLIHWLLAASFVLALIAYAYLGSYSRYTADDYTVELVVRKNGWLGAQLAWYKGWTGRFSFSFVCDLVALAGPAATPFIPGLLLTLWFAATVWAVYEIHPFSGKVSWARNVLIAGFVIFATLETAPSLAHSLYWQTGALTYLFPLIVISLFVAVVSRGLRKRSGKFYLLCTGVLTLVAGGFSDTFLVMQNCGLIVSILAVQIFAEVDFKSRIRPFLLAGLVGALLALIIVALAPGNSVRLAQLPKQLSGWSIMKLTVICFVLFVRYLVLTHPVICLASLSLPLLIVLRGDGRMWNRRLSICLLWLTPVATVLLITSGIAIGVYTISAMLPERAQILLCFVFVCGTVVWSRALGEYLLGKFPGVRDRIRQIVSLVSTVTLLLLAISPLISFFSVLGIREKARSYAADWDRQDSELKIAKQSGVTDVAVEQIGDFQSRIGKGPSELHLRSDSAFWINRTIASYYGLSSVRATRDVE